MKLDSVIYFLLLLIFSRCQQPIEKQTHLTQSVDTAQLQVDTTSAGVEVTSDSVNTLPTEAAPGLRYDFSYKSYFLTSDYDQVNCDALARCDCCSSEIYFMDEARYVYSDMCEGEQNFLKGNYEVLESVITLNHDSLYVYDLQPFGDEEDSEEFGTFQDTKKFDLTTIKIEECNGKILLHLISGSYSEYGTEDNERTHLSTLINNKSSEITQKLELK